MNVVKWTHNPEFEVNDLDDGVVLFDTSRRVMHHLNGPATLVWEVLHDRTEADLTDIVVEVLEVPHQEAVDVVRSALHQLAHVGAITQCTE